MKIMANKGNRFEGDQRFNVTMNDEAMKFNKMIDNGKNTMYPM